MKLEFNFEERKAAQYPKILENARPISWSS